MARYPHGTVNNNWDRNQDQPTTAPFSKSRARPAAAVATSIIPTAELAAKRAVEALKIRTVAKTTYGEIWECAGTDLPFCVWDHDGRGVTQFRTDLSARRALTFLEELDAVILRWSRAIRSESWVNSRACYQDVVMNAGSTRFADRCMVKARELASKPDTAGNE